MVQRRGCAVLRLADLGSPSRGVQLGLSDGPGRGVLRIGRIRRASDLLELVQALNSVTKMKLGSLVGKDRWKVLRELNEQLVVY